MADPIQLPLFPDQASLRRFHRMEIWPDLFGQALLRTIAPRALRPRAPVYTAAGIADTGSPSGSSRYPPPSVTSRRAFAGSGSIFWRSR